MTYWGYIRNTTSSKNIKREVSMLEDYGCYEVIIEAKNSRGDSLNHIINQLKDGDALVITDMKQLGKRVCSIVDLIKDFDERSISLIVLDLNVNTRNNSGELFKTYMETFIGVETEHIKNAQRIGIDNALSRGVKFGNASHQKWTKQDLMAAIDVYLNNKEKSVKQILNKFQIPRSSFYAELKNRGVSGRDTNFKRYV